MVKVNVPVEEVDTDEGVVATATPLKVTVSLELQPKWAPVMVTTDPGSPEFGLSVMCALDHTVNFAEVPTPPEDE